MSTASGRRRRGSTSSATGEPPFEWDARNVTPATFLEAEMHWRNTLGAQHKKRSKSTGALAALKISSENARHLAAATARPDFAAAPQALSFLDMVVRELSWGGFFQKSHAQHRPSSHISNFMAVPARMERFVFFGHLVALDLFLFHITWLPLRVISSALLGAAALCRVAAPTWLWGVVVYCSSCCCCRSSAHAHGRRVCAFGHAQQFDLLKAVIIVCSTFLLGSVQPGRLYHYIRGEATLKLYVFFNILSVIDTLASSFGQDVIDALLKTTRDAAGDVFSAENLAEERSVDPVGPGTIKKHRRALLQLIFYTVLAVGYVSFHAAIIFVQSVCLSVAVNSRGNALLPLLVSSNFMELKSSVFKRYEAEQLFQISCSDAVEQFQISLHLLLIALQQAPTSWDDAYHLAGTLLVVWIVEVVVDSVKHSFISKFNRLSADLYDTFSGILAHDLLSVRMRQPTSLDPTHASARRLGFAILPLTCVVLRLTVSNILPAWLPRFSALGGVLAAVLAIAVLCAAKLLCGMSLLVYAAAVVRRQKKNLSAAVARQRQILVHAEAVDAPTPIDSNGSVEASEHATTTASFIAAPPLPKPDLLRLISVGSSSVRCSSRGPAPLASPPPRPPILSLGRSESSVFFINEDTAVLQPLSPAINDSGRFLAQLHAAKDAQQSCDSIPPSKQWGEAGEIAYLPSLARAEGKDARHDQAAALAVPELAKTPTPLASRDFPTRPAAISRAPGTSPELSDALTPAQLDSLLMIDKLSQVERYSLHGRPAPM